MSVSIDILEGYSLRVLVGILGRNLSNVQNRVGDNASAPSRLLFRQGTNFALKGNFILYF